MANASSNDALHSTNKRVPRNYLPQRTRQVKFLPPEDVIKLVSGARVRCYRTVVRKPSMFDGQRWNPKTRCSSHARTAQFSKMISHTNANQTGKAHQEGNQTPNPPANRSKGSKSCLPKSNPKTSSNRHSVSVVPHQKPKFGVSKKKTDNLLHHICSGQEQAQAHKRKSAHEDGPNSKKPTHVAVEGCNP